MIKKLLVLFLLVMTLCVGFVFSNQLSTMSFSYVFSTYPSDTEFARFIPDKNDINSEFDETNKPVIDELADLNKPLYYMVIFSNIEGKQYCNIKLTFNPFKDENDEIVNLEYDVTVLNAIDLSFAFKGDKRSVTVSDNSVTEDIIDIKVDGLSVTKVFQFEYDFNDSELSSLSSGTYTSTVSVVLEGD